MESANVSTLKVGCNFKVGCRGGLRDIEMMEGEEERVVTDNSILND